MTFEEAVYIFSDKYSLTLFDEEHSEDEERWILLGKSLNAMVLVVIHVFRDKDGIEIVRIISARNTTKKE